MLCSFLVGRGSAGTVSFMGKGVSAKAAVALTHFLHSVKFRNPPQVKQYISHSDIMLQCDSMYHRGI